MLEDQKEKSSVPSFGTCESEGPDQQDPTRALACSSAILPSPSRLHSTWVFRPCQEKKKKEEKKRKGTEKHSRGPFFRPVIHDATF